MYLDARAELAEAEARADRWPMVTAAFLDPDSDLWCLPDESLVDCGSD